MRGVLDMSRDLTAGMQTAIAAETVRPVALVKITLDTDTILVHSGVGDIVFNGDTYLGVGNFGDITEIKESESIAPTQVSVSLSGIPPEYLSFAMDEDYQGREAFIYKALLDENHDLIADPVLAFRGRCDYSDIQLGATATVQLTIQSRLADWNRPKIRRYSHEDQQLDYPGDLSLEFVPQMVEKPIVWGK